MAKINSLDHETLQKIADMLRKGSYLPINAPRPQSLRDARSGPRVVRWAKTTTDDDFPTYPSAPANVYVVRLGKPNFEMTPGWVDDMGWEDYSPAEYRIAFDPAGRYWPEGSLVEVELHHDQWYFTGNARYHFVGQVDEYGISAAEENESGDWCPGSGTVKLFQFDTASECLSAVEVDGVQQTLTVRTLQSSAISADSYVLLHETRDGIWWVENPQFPAHRYRLNNGHPTHITQPSDYLWNVYQNDNGPTGPHPDFRVESDGADDVLLANLTGTWIMHYGAYVQFYTLSGRKAAGKRLNMQLLPRSTAPFGTFLSSPDEIHLAYAINVEVLQGEKLFGSATTLMQVQKDEKMGFRAAITNETSGLDVGLVVLLTIGHRVRTGD